MSVFTCISSARSSNCSPITNCCNACMPRRAGRLPGWSVGFSGCNPTSYVPGKTNPADPLSHLPVVGIPHRDRNIAEDYVHAVLTYAVPKSMTREDIRIATEKDICLTELWSYDHVWHLGQSRSEHRWYARCPEELSITDGLILCGMHIVMPFSLRNQTLGIAHEMHQG